LSAWLFQGNERTTFPIGEYLRRGMDQNSGEISWTVGPRRLPIRPGDRAFMWRAEVGKPGTGGLIGVGVASTEPFRDPANASELWYDPADPRAVDPAVWWVGIRLEELRLAPGNGMVRRAELLDDSILRDLCIIVRPRQTVCAVDPRHERALMERWSAKQPTDRTSRDR
jgi:hypothetical protein